MHKTFCYGAMMLGLLGSAALAQTSPTQEKSLDQAQQQTAPAQQGTTGHTSAPDHTVPPPPHAQPQAPIADQAKPAAVGPSQANTTDKLGGPADFATPQTMPSTLSEKNAALDKLPTTALQLPLTDEQKKLIASSVANAQPQTSTSLSNVHVADFLPIAVAPQEFSPDLKQKLPEVGRYKFVKLDKRVLIVDPPLGAVVGEIIQ